MNINIKNVEIEIGKKILNLSLEQAKELRDKLNADFPTYTPHYPYYPYWYSSNITDMSDLSIPCQTTGNPGWTTTTGSTVAGKTDTLSLVVN